MMDEQWPTILIVEDDKLLVKSLRRTLVESGFYVDEAYSLGAARACLRRRKFDLVLLDMELPDGSGKTLLKYIRSWEKTMPVIVMTVIGDLPIRLETFDLGSNDFISKPFFNEELVARIRAHLKTARRSEIRDEPAMSSLSLQLDKNSRSLVSDGRRVSLRRKLYDLCALFFRSPGQVFTKDQIFCEVWPEREFDHNTLMVHVAELREILSDWGEDAPEIQTIRGIGYRLIPGEEKGSR